VDGFGRTVYLTGSHTWNQCGDGFDYEAYLDFLQKYHHNFIRLWSGDYGISGSPPAYLRPGPGKALDGGRKVDLSQPNPAYFDRVRSCAEAARKRGIYVAISFFPIDSAKRQSDRDESPYFAPNNLQELGADADGNGHLSEAFDLSIPELTAYQEAFARKLIDAVNDLDNVLYEIGNEGDVRSAAWQYHLVRIIREHEFRKPKQHLVGITAMLDWPTHTDGSNEVLLASPADWVSLSGVSYRADVPASDGTKASILDTDHISVVKPDWVWKCFTRGHHPILMDWYGHESLPMNWYTADEQEVIAKLFGLHAPVCAEDGARRNEAGGRTFVHSVLLGSSRPRVPGLPTGPQQCVHCRVDPGRLHVRMVQPRVRDDALSRLADSGEDDHDFRGSLRRRGHPVPAEALGTRSPT